MRIQHNIMAMSAYRNYTNNVSAMKKNLEKLSSGYKINRAGDDAAGLAISEKMRAQITGLETAQKNAKDGISLVQTAEGALTEVHDMLNRMVELATMSANGTYDNNTDRAQLQKEMDQLRSEINRIADSSNFNGIKLLDGSMGTAMGKTEQVTVTAVADGSQGGTDAQKGVYTVDLKDLKINLKANAAGSYMAALTGAKLNIGGVDLNFAAIGTVTSIVEDGIITGEELVSWMADNPTAANAQATNAAAGASIGGGGKAQFTFEGSTITATMLTAPTTDTDIPKNMTVSLTLPTGYSHDNSFDQAVHAETPAKVADPDKVAQGKFDLTKYVVDGGQLTIGDDTYTFKVGKDSMVSGSGGNIIDLSKYEADDPNLVKYAAEALSQAGKNNKLFDVTTDSQGNTIYLTERKDALNYNKDWDLKGSTGSTSDGKWNEAVKDGNRKTGVVTFSAPTGTNNSLTLQIGDTADSFNQLKVTINDCHTEALGLNSISISDQASAAKAVDAIKAAINYVSDVRGTLGATQNRLDHTINNLAVMTENIQDAESTIRDVDVAEEMMAYTKNNILIQSAQAMLAQANQVPQGVLQLLQ